MHHGLIKSSHSIAYAVDLPYSCPSCPSCPSFYIILQEFTAKLERRNTLKKIQTISETKFAHFLLWFFPRGLHVLQLAYSDYFQVLDIASTGSLVLLSYPPMDGSSIVWAVDFGFIAVNRLKQETGSKHGVEYVDLVHVVSKSDLHDSYISNLYGLFFSGLYL